jgi:hypothetical protein
MRIPSSGIFVSLATAVAKWFQPPVFVAVILIFTLVVALRRAEQMKSWRQWPIVVIVLGSGLTIALAFLVAVRWMQENGVH